MVKNSVIPINLIGNHIYSPLFATIHNPFCHNAFQKFHILCPIFPSKKQCLIFSHEYYAGAADQNYTTMLRFRLIEKERRTFVAERFCFRGAIDDWIFLGGPDDLKKLVGRYIRLLRTDKFFDSLYY